MAIKIDISVTMHDGDKPQFSVNGDWATALADFNLVLTAQNGETTIVPSLQFDTK